MATHYVDLDLTGSGDTGANWANAFQTISSAFPQAAGDFVFVRGTELLTAGTVIDFGGSAGNPVIIIGVPTGGSPSEPPTQAQIIQGWRTGDDRTVEANKAAYDTLIPVIGTDGVNKDIVMDGYAYFYGIQFDPFRKFYFSTEDHYFVFEECLFTRSQNAAGYGFHFTQTNTIVDVGGNKKLIGCVFDAGTATSVIEFDPGTEIIECSFASGMTTNTRGIFNSAQGNIHIGCDYSNAAHDLVYLPILAGSDSDPLVFDRCQFHASSALTDGTADSDYRIELNQCVFGDSGRTTRVVDHEIYSFRGNVLHDTVNHLTSGAANDGLTDYSHAFTTTAAKVLDNYVPLVGPWMHFDVAGDGTSQTVTVLINNSGASDLEDDEVWLEVVACSEAGTAKANYYTGQMQLLDTPSSSNSFISNDTTAWDNSLTQAQKLTVAIAPDYDGPMKCRVMYAKAVSAPTLYVNPEPTVA